MNYHIPGENQFVINEHDDICLFIPRDQQRNLSKTSFFSVMHNGIRRIDIFQELQRNCLIIIKALAEIIGIPGYKKIKKDDLILLIQHRIIFS